MVWSFFLVGRAAIENFYFFISCIGPILSEILPLPVCTKVLAAIFARAWGNPCACSILVCYFYTYSTIYSFSNCFYNFCCYTCYSMLTVKSSSYFLKNDSEFWRHMMFIIFQKVLMSWTKIQKLRRYYKILRISLVRFSVT